LGWGVKEVRFAVNKSGLFWPGKMGVLNGTGGATDGTATP